MRAIRCFVFLGFKLQTIALRLAEMEENIPDRLMVLAPCFRDVDKRD